MGNNACPVALRRSMACALTTNDHHYATERTTQTRAGHQYATECTTHTRSLWPGAE